MICMTLAGYNLKGGRAMKKYCIFIECIVNAESVDDAEKEAKRINNNIKGCEFVSTTDILEEK